MVTRLLSLIALLLCLLVGRVNANLLEQLSTQNTTNNDTFLAVDEAFVFDYQMRTQALEIRFAVTPEYYLYRAQFNVRADNNTQTLLLDLPKGETFNDPYFGLVEIYPRDVSFSLPVEQIQDAQRLHISYQGCAKAGLCYPPETISITLPSAVNKASSSSNINEATAGNAPTTQKSDMPAQSALNNAARFGQNLNEQPLALSIALFFAIGLGLALTPCVFPMYPILTGIIVGQKQHTSNTKVFGLSLAYVQGMALTYTALGLVVASAGLKFQAALQHPVVLSGIALMFVALALSMFGLYQLQLPSAWQVKLNQLSDKQGPGQFSGAFVMGMISGLIASPCTAAPLSGVLLYIAQSGDLSLGGLALYSLSLGMGVPLIIIGMGSGKLLPKAGVWMDWVKVFFGLLLLAVAIIMLERFITPNLARALWFALILGGSAYYYHQNRLRPLSLTQSLRQLGLLLIMGLSVAWASLPLWQVKPAQVQGQFITVNSLSELNTQLRLAASKQQNVLVDFYADWCVACKDFEHKTFKNARVANKLASMVLLKADVTKITPQSSELLAHYNVLGLPTLLLFNAQGQELTQGRITGFMDGEAFYAHLLLNGL